MSALSVFKDGIFIGCANPIFPISDENGKLIFEVFESDASSLKNRLGKIDEYSVDGGETFSGELLSLEMCPSTHPGLAFLRHKPTMRAVMTVHKPVSHVRQ